MAESQAEGRLVPDHASGPVTSPQAEGRATVGRVVCYIVGHNAKGAEINYCGRSYTYRCQRCGSHVREWWS